MAEFSAAIIGAGPAGLAAALTLSRALQPTIVFDSPRSPRNSASPGFGGLLGRELASAKDLHAIGREEIDRYGFVRFHAGDAVQVEGNPNHGFTIVASDGMTATAGCILLACGMVDLFPEIRRLADFWGTSVINCPFCHGFELRERPWGVVVNRAEMLEVAEIYLQWTDDLILFVEAGLNVPPGREAKLASKGVRIDRRGIRRLLGDGSELHAVGMEDGAVIERQALVLWPFQSQTGLIKAMGVPLNDAGCVIVDDGFRTQSPGIYAAGDLIYSGHQNVNTAIHMGSMAASAMVLDLPT